jgi:hypothetical protein
LARAEAPRDIAKARQPERTPCLRRKQLEEAAEAAKQVDWTRIDAITDEEIKAAARSDPDNSPLTDEDLAQMRRVTPRRSKNPSAAE